MDIHKLSTHVALSVQALVDALEADSAAREQARTALQASFADAGLSPELSDAVFEAAAMQAQINSTLGRSDDARTIVIVGGKGAMGSLFAKLFHARGHTVRTVDADDWQQAPELLSGAELVLVAVPIDVTLETIEKLGPMLQAIPDSCVLADITSVKVEPMRAMLAAHTGPVLGLHPMFGPGLKTLLGQAVFAVPGRGEGAIEWVVDELAALGARVLRTTAAQHDNDMVMIQALRHFSTFALGSYLAHHADTTSHALEAASPAYRMELDLIARLFAQDAQLYADIMLAGDDRAAAISTYAGHVSGLAQLVLLGDRDQLLEQFASAGEKLGVDRDAALAESDALIRSLAARIAVG